MIITEEMVEKAARATAIFFKADKQPDMSGDPFAKMLPHKKRECFDAARAALEAVAPLLIAQGMADAVSIARRTLIWSADQEAKFVDALCDAIRGA